METYILGTDIGTGSVKTVAIDITGKHFCSSQYYYPTINPQPGFSEQNSNEIFEAFLKSTCETVSKIGKHPLAISLSSAMHGIMAVDKNCKALSNLIIWSDLRSSKIANELRNSPEGKIIYTATGTPIHSMSPLCKIIWLKKNAEELFQKTHKFISIKEYIWYQLFNEFKVDYSIASATGLFDIGRLTWNETALNLAKISPECLSDPVPTHYLKKGLKKEIAVLLTIPADTSFCIGASDGCLANLGTDSIKTGIAAVTIGTSGAVRITRKSPLPNFSIMNFNYLLDEKTFICGAPINNAGNIIEWLLKKFLLNKSPAQKNYNELFDMIDKVPAGCKGLIFLPYLNGERAPVWDEQSCGVFFGITMQHDQAFFLRAAVEGICFALLEILKAIEIPAEPVKQINASGGFIHSAIWVQILADITSKKISVQHTEDASAIGAAYLAFKALNLIQNYSSLQQETKIYIYPQKKFETVYEKNYTIFKTLYPLLKDSMHLASPV